MSRDSKAGAHTFEQIRGQYDEWAESRPPIPRRERPRSTGPTLGDTMGKYIFTAIGVGTGILLLTIAAYTFWSAALWVGYARNGAATGYFVTGFFLLIAGVGCILATWNHNFRVLDPDRAPAAHH